MSVRYICDGCGAETSYAEHYTFHACRNGNAYQAIGKREWCKKCAVTIEGFIRDWKPLPKDQQR